MTHVLTVTDESGEKRYSGTLTECRTAMIRAAYPSVRIPICVVTELTEHSLVIDSVPALPNMHVTYQITEVGG
jgi:hypothetical protein